MENLNYKLDRTAFQKLSFEEADQQINNSEGLPMAERFRQFNYLMSVAYNFLGQQWPKMDKTHF